MPDFKSAMQSAGLKGSPPQAEGGGGRPRQQDLFQFPKDYPDYFSNDGVLKKEYVTTLAADIAGAFGRGRLAKSQLRAFYSHAKQQEQALEFGRALPEVMLQLQKMKYHANDRATKGNIPRVFQQFIDRNLDKVNDRKLFLEGFMEHFQAVVGYCADLKEAQR